MKSPCCNTVLVLRGKSKRVGEVLLTCPTCQGKWQCREGKYSHPYQVKRKSDMEIKSIPVSGRMRKSDYERIIREHKTFQKFLDSLR